VHESLTTATSRAVPSAGSGAGTAGACPAGVCNGACIPFTAKTGLPEPTVPPRHVGDGGVT
jgi:hypothetical protein